MAIRYPPFDFPLYGLDATWSGPRWLNFFEGKVGSPSWAAWLGHGYDADGEPGSQWVTVGTFSRRRCTEVQLLPGETFERYLATVATLALFNDSAEGPAKIETEPDRWSAWPSTPLIADGQPVSAWFLERGDAWAGFSTGVPRVGLVIHASGIARGDVTLTEVTDSSLYHFNSDEPLAYADVLRASRKAAFENSPDSGYM